MNSKILIIILVVLFPNLQLVSAAENDYGIVNAWYNGINATVEGTKLKIGEPAEIETEIISKIDGDITLKIKEPGVTQAFKVINGPSKQDEWIDNLKVTSGWNKKYKWIITPNGAWKNGNAPINILVQFNKGMNDKIIQFTIANPYILDEQYSGSTPLPTTPATQPTPTGTSSQQKQASFLSASAALVLMLGVWIIRKKPKCR